MSLNSTTAELAPVAKPGTNGHGAGTQLAIEARGLVKLFGENRAVDGLDLDVPKGMVYGVLGPNGAGKTTAIRMLTTLLKPDGGSATVLGFDLVKDAGEIRSRVSLTGQFASVDEDLSGTENLVLLGKLYGYGRARAKERASATARGLRPGRRGEPAGEELLRRHAAAAGHRGEHCGDARTAVPR